MLPHAKLITPQYSSTHIRTERPIPFHFCCPCMWFLHALMTFPCSVGVPAENPSADPRNVEPLLYQQAPALATLPNCTQYSEALASETSSGGSDTDILRLKAGTLVNFLDWALPEGPRQAPSGAHVRPAGIYLLLSVNVLDRFRCI